MKLSPNMFREKLLVQLASWAVHQIELFRSPFAHAGFVAVRGCGGSISSRSGEEHQQAWRVTKSASTKLSEWTLVR